MIGALRVTFINKSSARRVGDFRQNEEEGKDHESIQSSTHLTLNTIYESGKDTSKHNTQDSQELSP